MSCVREMRSAYMEWVKTCTDVRFNLANSGVKNYSLSALPINWDTLELSGPGAYGYRPLVEAIARKCGVDPTCVATAQGTSMANHLAMAGVLERGDEVLIESPAYPLLGETAQYLGAVVHYFDRSAESNFALDPAAIERAMTPGTRLIVISNLHNPSCAYIDETTLRRTGEIARRMRAKVLVDEVYLDLLFENAPETAFKLGTEFIVTSSLTKVYGLSGLRCGWIFAEPDLIRRIYRLNDLFGVNNPYLTDQVSCVALGMLDRIGRWAKDLLDRNRTVANEFLRAAPEVDCKGVAAGTVLFPRIQCSVDTLRRVLRERFETIVTPGHFFGAPDRIRIGIGGETEVLAEGLTRIQQALRLVSANRTAPR